MKLSILVILFLFSPLVALGSDSSLLVRNVIIVDPSGETSQDSHDIEIIDGRISRIGQQLKSQAQTLIDGTGTFVIPGLIDSHVHIKSVPGAVLRKNSKEQIDSLLNCNLGILLAAGVTTVLDAASPESLLREAEVLNSGRNSPRILGLAPFLSPEKGYFTSSIERGHTYDDLWPAVRSAAELSQMFSKAKTLHPVGAKVTIEKGMGPFEVFPAFSAEFRREIQSQAKKANLPLYVHSMSNEEHELALSLDPHAFVHAGYYDESPDESILRQILQKKTYVITTAAIYKMMLLMWDHSEMDSSWLRQLVPSQQVASAMDQGLRTKVIEQMVLINKPWWIPGFVAKAMAPIFMNPNSIQKNLDNSLKALKQMHQIGIPLVAGSDSGNWPLWTSFSTA